jgi:hypothetical protein
MPIGTGYTQQELQDLAMTLELVNKIRGESKAATGTPVNPYLHGPGGLFGVAGIDRDVFSTRIQARGLASRLSAYPDIYMNPLYAYISGYQNVSGSNPTNVCDTPQTAGAMKNCLQTAQFGRKAFQTRELEINRVGQLINRGEFVDLNVINDPLVPQIGGAIFSQFPQQDQILAGREMLARMLEVGIGFSNWLLSKLYTGNPTNNTAGGGYKEFPGLDILIGTNKVDALTGTSCPSLASDIKSFNYGRVDTVTTANDIVNVMTYMARYLSHNAEYMGFGETKWVITMRKDLFYEITAVWPCSYLTYRCQFRTTDGTVITNVSASDQVAMRDAMRAGSYLLIDGVQWEVVLDDGIVEHNRSGSTNIPIGGFESDIYFVPLTVRGNVPVTYWQYFDYQKGSIQAAQDAHYTNEFWTDGGKYLWVKEPNVRWCVLLSAKIEPRVILRTPQLAGRIADVVYVPLQHMRDALPTDYYFVDGGVSTARAAPSYYSDWNLPA